MHKSTTIIAEHLPCIRTTDFKDRRNGFGKKVVGKYNNLNFYEIRYFRTEKSIELNYVCDHKEITQSIDIRRNISNLGIGNTWYLICPKSGRPSRKLVLWCGRFVNQNVISNLYYFDQTVTKMDKSLRKMINRKRRYELLQQKVNQKYAKGRYKGNLTHHAAELGRAHFLHLSSFENLSYF